MEHYYTKLLNEWEAIMDTLEARVFSVLRQAYPEGRTRRQLVLDVYGEEASENINNDTRDRGIRMAISKMRKRNIPVFATSGGSGYRLEMSENTLGKMISDMRGRRERLDETITSLEKTRARLKYERETSLPDVYPAREKVKQLSFMEKE
jgi:gamma-glutamyl-gamma-aminobutyrate hydrolase PuuD